jgi:hypothetical protein
MFVEHAPLGVAWMLCRAGKQTGLPWSMNLLNPVYQRRKLELWNKIGLTNTECKKMEECYIISAIQ